MPYLGSLWWTRFILQRGHGGHLPGRVRVRALAVSPAARRTRASARAGLPPAHAPSRKRRASFISATTTGSSWRSLCWGSACRSSRSRACPTRGPSGRRWSSGSSCGRSTCRSSTSARSSMASGGSRCCSRRASSSASSGPSRMTPRVVPSAALALDALPRGVRRGPHQAAPRPLLARSDVPLLPLRDAAAAQPSELVLPPAAEAAPSLQRVLQPLRAARASPSASSRRSRSPRSRVDSPSSIRPGSSSAGTTPGSTGSRSCSASPRSARLGPPPVLASRRRPAAYDSLLAPCLAGVTIALSVKPVLNLFSKVRR